MSDLTTIIKERRAVREYTDEMPSKDLIEEVIRAGLWAPSGRNKQTPVTIAITNPQVRQMFVEKNKHFLGIDDDEEFDPFHGAPCILCVIANAKYPTAVYDGTLTLGYMMLKAQELGLGTCWVHRCKEEFEDDFGKEIVQILGLPEEEYIGVGHLALGYPAGKPKRARERKPGRVFYIE